MPAFDSRCFNRLQFGRKKKKYRGPLPGPASIIEPVAPTVEAIKKTDDDEEEEDDNGEDVSKYKLDSEVCDFVYWYYFCI